MVLCCSRSIAIGRSATRGHRLARCPVCLPAGHHLLILARMRRLGLRGTKAGVWTDAYEQVVLRLPQRVFHSGFRGECRDNLRLHLRWVRGEEKLKGSDENRGAAMIVQWSGREGCGASSV